MSDAEPRRAYLYALSVAYQSVPGHANAARYRACNADRENCMGSLTVGDLVMSRG